MIGFWRFLLGYLTITIEGENGEQILNRATANGISIWNLTYKHGKICGNISAQNFYLLRKIKRGTKCKISITARRGFNFYINRYKNRVGFIVGSAIFTFLLIFLSNFVWIINVEGNVNLPKQEIISSCKKIGIREGVFKGKINNKYDAQRLQLTQSGIAWCSLNIEGCVLTVNISETTVSDKETRQNPSNLKAKIEGKVKKIDVTSGNVSVKVGDTVSKGDLLVSGVTQNLTSTLFVHSEGVVIAETKRVFSAEGKYVQQIYQETGKKITRYTLNIFNSKIPLYLGNINKPYNYNNVIKEVKIFDKKIPIKIATEQYKITQKTSIAYDKNELEEMLYNDIKNQVEKFDFINAIEGEREVVYTDKGILLKIHYTCEENIAVQDEILFDSTN